MKLQLGSSVGVRGVMTIRKQHADGSGETVRINNEVVGEWLLAKLAANISGREEIDRLSVDDTGDAPLVSLLPVSFTAHNGTDAFASWLWVCPAGTGTGDWDDLYVGTAGDDRVSQFLARNGVIGTKDAGDSWLVVYTLYFVPLVMS